MPRWHRRRGTSHSAASRGTLAGPAHLVATPIGPRLLIAPLLLRVMSGVDAVRPVRSTIVDMSGSPTIPHQSAASPSPEVDAYIGTCPESSRARLIMLREAIREEAPHATERIAYGTATWHAGENIIHIGGYARHVGVYPGTEAMIAFADEVQGFVTSKGAIQIPHDRELPLDLVRRLTRWRVDHIAAKGGGRGKASVEPVRDPGPIHFSATLHRSDASGAACFVDFPWNLRETFGKGNLVPVVATWDDRVEYRGSLARMGGEHAMLLCRKDVLAELGKGPGEVVHVTVTLDLAPREADVPDALATAIDAARHRCAANLPSGLLMPSARKRATPGYPRRSR
ncbi:MAG: DUF1905 domain-containing protein [Proteobacteria bacterium]|nr:DUF1905 domain-containing protein [Pseudomonadota bacterium]